MPSLFLTCAPGYEAFLADELRRRGLTPEETGSGWVRAQGAAADRLFNGGDLCFGRIGLDNPDQLTGDDGGLAQRLCDFFCESIRGEKIKDVWPLHIEALDAQAVSAERVRKIGEEFAAKLRKAVSRVAKLADLRPVLDAGTHEGLFVVCVTGALAMVSRRCWSGGQRRMSLDPDAPSRSFLKVEEACTILGTGPEPGERVIDLGAAPGGWSYSAARRGARVTAVDNGPLKAGAASHPGIEHRREDAFTFALDSGEKADWLLCDMVEDPMRVLPLVRQWLARGWCRAFIVNLKFGRSDPGELIDLVRDKRQGLPGSCTRLLIRHLFHDREEITVMGVGAGSS